MPTWLSGPERSRPLWLSARDLLGVRPQVLLGRGEGAEVWEAEVPRGREVSPARIAWKLGYPATTAALAREARALLLAGGSGVPALLGIGRSGDRLGLALELVVGLPLGESARASSNPAELALRLLWEVGLALDGLHQLGVAHGDVKPDNIVVTAEGRLVLLDLGLSHALDEVATGGTLAYMDPALLGVADARRFPAADAFALALTAMEVLDERLRGDPDPARGQRARLSAPFDRLLVPFVRGAPSQRPGLGWLLRELDRGEHRMPIEGRLRAAYLDVRREEVTRKVALAGPAGVQVAVEGACGEWLRELVELETLLDLGADRPAGSPQNLGELAPADRQRLVSRIGGPQLARLAPSSVPDQELLDGLRSGLRRFGFGCIPVSAFRPQAVAAEGAPRALEPLQLALALGQRPVSPEVLDQIEATPGLPVDLVVLGARALARQGEVFRAIAWLTPLDHSWEARLVRADLERRRGNSEVVRTLVEELSRATLTGDLAARLAALRARLEVDQGRPGRALELLSSASTHPAVCETWALACLAMGDLDGAREQIAEGLAQADDDEQRARLQGTLGMVEHQLGRADQARRAFRRARDAAEVAGALVEEATYSTGLAAAASDAGRLLEALQSSERAEQIFEALGRPGDAARAVLGQASVLASLQQPEELEQRVARGLGLSSRSGDQRCAGYLQLCLADALPPPRGIGAAEQAARLLADGSEGDRLRAAARLLIHGGDPRVDGDRLAESVQDREPLIDWWTARARRAARHGPAPVGEREGIIQRLLALSAPAPAPISLGPALLFGQELALSLGRVEVARVFHARARHLAQRFKAEAGHELSARIAEVEWVQLALSSTGEGFAPAQLSDIELLLRALSQRGSLRELLRQALDLLLLWTGVERGLVLLTAPGEKLVVRAARNLGREDLSEAQLSLSRSLAARAAREGRPIVTVDAQREGGDLHKSAHALRLRSILAVPLIAHGEVLGVAYLDDRVRPGAFGEKELAWSQLIGTVTALAVAEERDRLSLRRAIRRASRAEAQLAEQLARTRGELEVATRELKKARREVFLRGDYADIIGRGTAMTRVLELVDRVATADVPVLITGESGTGKELIARAIARAGNRGTGPFVAENCAAVPESLLESTLFGHQRGSFTGATKDQPGLLELADQGTLFLDEVGEMTLAMQAKLLRVLQDGEVRPLGARRARKVDVRLICATHRDLGQMVREGKFREDLFYRLNVVPLALPPLRERPEDVDALVDHFVKRYDPQGRRTVSMGVRERFRTFSWPGNVRQLENEIRRMLLLGGRELTLADVSPLLRSAPETPEGQTLRDKLNELEKQLVIEALEAHRGNRTRAAEALGVSRFGLQKMMQRLSIPGD